MVTFSIHPALLQTSAASRDGLAVAADISMVVVGVSILVLSVALVLLLLKVNKTLNSLRSGVTRNLVPVSDRARSISDNVEFITQALRTDVERLNASVRALTDRLQQASERMEERIEEFNALMEVVQGEAEDIFIDTAATVRGVKHGALSLARNAAEPGGADSGPEVRGDGEQHAAEPEAIPAGEDRD